MTDKIEITKITLGTKGGIKVELSLEEAKELHGQLDTLFGSKVAYVPGYPIYMERNYPYWQPYRPVWSGNTVGCSGRSGLRVTYSGSGL